MTGSRGSSSGSAAPDDPDQITKDYIRRVFELRQTHAQPPTQNELEAIALELGLSPAELEQAQQQAQKHLTLGQNFLQYERWQDAIEELEKGVALNPTDLEFIYPLAQAYQRKYQAQHLSSDRQMAITLAKQCLDIEPDYVDALELLNVLDPTPKSSRSGWVTGCLGLSVIGLAILGLAAFWLTPMQSEVQSPQPELAAPVESGPEAGSSDAVPPEPAPPSSAPQTESDASSTPPGEVEIPVEFSTTSNSPEMSVEVRSSRLSNYDAGSYYTLQGILVNASNQELERVKLNIEFLGAGDAPISTEIKDVLTKGHALMRPGDRHPFHMVFKTTPELQTIRMTVNLVDQTPAATSYPPAQRLNPEWAFQQPAEPQFQIKERRTISQAFGSGNGYHTAELEVTNTGETAIRRLKVQIDRYDANQNLIDSQERSVVSTINPPLLPGETYLTRSSASLKAPFSHYTLKVIELE